MKSRNPANFPDWIRWKRKEALMTQMEVAEAAGMSHVTLCRIELGRCGYSPDTVRRLAYALGVEASDALVRAGFGHLADFPDHELARHLEGLSKEQQRLILNTAKAMRDSMLMRDTTPSARPVLSAPPPKRVARSAT